MEVTIIEDAGQLSPDTAVGVVFFKGQTTDDVAFLSERQRQQLRAMEDQGARLSRMYEMTLLPAEESGHAVLVVGGGDRDQTDPLTPTRIAAAASRYLTGRGYSRLAAVYRGRYPAEEFACAVVEGAIGGAYNIGLKKTTDGPQRHLESLTIMTTGGNKQDLVAGARIGQIVGESRTIARDLVNLPPNEITPSALADRAQQLASQYGLECEILDENRIHALGMGSLLGVAAGSRQPPRVIVLRYGDRSASTKLALVGKGLTFDSGGLSLKTHEGMETMKGDMAGSAAVIAGMAAVARLAPKNISVTGYVGATENMPGGEAMRPGDILTAMNGKTIEVLNTDAEGRLVLADVLAYACKEGATHIVDFATLTGAAMVALGNAATLATGKPMDWVQEVVRAADAGLDRSWAMPQYKEYREAMDSEVADLKNTGGRGGGALNAAAFLSEFVDGVPWAHMDIAGTSFARESKPYRSSGATGVGVGAIVNLVRRLSGAGHPATE